jgi:hypothetical protein
VNTAEANLQGGDTPPSGRLDPGDVTGREFVAAHGEKGAVAGRSCPRELRRLHHLVLGFAPWPVEPHSEERQAS